jgi:hypothetical protein
VGVFLVVAHIAMIFGMADPNMFMEKGDIEHMPGMSHP